MTYEEEILAAKAAKEGEVGVGNVFTTDELTEKFDIESFLAPLCFGRDRATGEKVTFIFQHSPRIYWRN